MLFAKVQSCKNILHEWMSIKLIAANNPFDNLYIHLSIRISRSVCPSVCPSVCLYIHPFIAHPSIQCDEIAQMVEWRTVEREVSGSNPAAGEFFVPCCSMSQWTGCKKSLPKILKSLKA